MKLLGKQLAFAALSLTALSACGDTGDLGNGRIKLLLTDAPGDIQAAVVTISRVTVQGRHGTTLLWRNPVTTDLVTLANTEMTLVPERDIENGAYTDLRFVITGAYIKVDNGDGTSSIFASSSDYEGLPPGTVVDGTLQMPSLSQSGLKVDLPGDRIVIEGGSTILLTDFSVAQSFGHTTGGLMWVLHPVITASLVQP
jgi:hypothetical protein